MYTWKSYYVVQADYQHWANDLLFNALDHLKPEIVGRDEGLFFKSIHHTVDHMLLVSQMWFSRLQGGSLNPNFREIQHADWRDLKHALRLETRHLQSWLDAQPEDYFEGRVAYTNSAGKPQSMWVRDALNHLFIHYAHHRGQVSAVITREGGPCPEMDYAYYRRDIEKLLIEARGQP